MQCIILYWVLELKKKKKKTTIEHVIEINYCDI